MNTIRILLAPRLSGGEYSRHLICIRGRTSNAEPPYTAIMSILPITHAGVFFVFWYFGFSESVYFASLYFRIFAFYFWAAAFSHYVHSLLHITFLGFITTLSWCLHTSWASIFHRISLSEAILKEWLVAGRVAQIVAAWWLRKLWRPGGWTNIPYSYFHTLLTFILYTVILLSDIWCNIEGMTGGWTNIDRLAGESGFL